MLFIGSSIIEEFLGKDENNVLERNVCIIEKLIIIRSFLCSLVFVKKIKIDKKRNLKKKWNV